MSSAVAAKPLTIPPGFEDDPEMIRLLKVAQEKPSLRVIHSPEVKSIEEWEVMYPELWLLIEITRQDEHQIHDGKLIATARDSIEFVDIKADAREKKVPTLTTRGVFLSPSIIGVPTCSVFEANDQLVTSGNLADAA